MRCLSYWNETPLGQQLAATLAELHGELSAPLKQAILLLCAALEEGHVCLDLAQAAGRKPGGQPLPQLASWRASLAQHPAVGRPGEFKPLILAGDRLYLARYWHYEQQLAQQLLQLAQPRTPTVDTTRLGEVLAQLFPPSQPAPGPDWQKVAAAAAVLQPLTLLSGGPGTGKTTTVVKLLAALQQLHAGQLIIRLAAPTGKAAARMSESIRDRKPALRLEPAIADSIPETASTLHRLLGSVPDSPQFRHHRNRPLALDVLVVDEASMIDLALMAKLVDALPAGGRLILLGDKDQLDSVEAGAVFGQLCGLRGYLPAQRAAIHAATGIELPALAPPASPVGACVMVLEHSYRFGSQPGIAALAAAANAANAAAASAALEPGKYADLAWHGGLWRSLRPALLARVQQGYAAYWQAVAAGDALAAFAAFGQFRLLSPHREGLTGVANLNAQLEQHWAQQGLLPADQRWYAGRPVMVVENDYSLQLFNGDIGLTLRQQDELKVVFPGEGGSWRWLTPARLPRHETAFAMTVHTSQGSEFDAVLLLLPDEASALLNRSLVYTGITRAKRSAEIWGPQAVLEAAIRNQPQRVSGLAQQLQAEGNQKPY